MNSWLESTLYFLWPQSSWQRDGLHERNEENGQRDGSRSFSFSGSQAGIENTGAPGHVPYHFYSLQIQPEGLDEKGSYDHCRQGAGKCGAFLPG